MRIVLALLITFLDATLMAATITAESLSPAHVQAAMDLAEAGDTVQLPAGTANWTSGIDWTAPANVTLRGAGTSATGGGDQTVIQDNIASDSRLMLITVNSAGVFRMTGITVQSGTGDPKDGGTVAFAGPGNVRIDHCHFIASSTANYKMLIFYTGLFGVMDQCILDFTGLNSMYFYNGRDGGGIGAGQGNYEWAQPTDFGGPTYFYIEDNIINGDVPSGDYSTRIYDGFTAAKVVVRFNDVSQATLGEAHATGHASDDRGTRSQEAYGNHVTSSLMADGPNFCALDMANGTALLWGNSWDQVYKTLYRFNVTRKDNATYPQSATPSGWGYAGTAFNGTGSNWDGNNDAATGYPVLDQPGRGQGDLLTGSFPDKENDALAGIAWPRQALEPIYIWNNTGTFVSGYGDSEYSNVSTGRVVANRDFYPPASGVQTTPSSPFDGTEGTGWGTLANRPATCTAGVAYWATDQGSWNSSTSNPYGVQQNGADGVLYVATATDTWTLYYTPYTYPHPLRGSSIGTATFGTLNVGP